MILTVGPPWKSSIIWVLHYLSFPSAGSYPVSVPERDNQIKPYPVPVEFAAPGIHAEKARGHRAEPTPLLKLEGGEKAST